jgi:hypothetical protein
MKNTIDSSRCPLKGLPLSEKPVELDLISNQTTKCLINNHTSTLDPLICTTGH